MVPGKIRRRAEFRAAGEENSLVRQNDTDRAQRGTPRPGLRAQLLAARAKSEAARELLSKRRTQRLLLANGTFTRWRSMMERILLLGLMHTQCGESIRTKLVPNCNKRGCSSGPQPLRLRRGIQ
jgi:hypothetical protein